MSAALSWGFTLHSQLKDTSDKGWESIPCCMWALTFCKRTWPDPSNTGRLIWRSKSKEVLTLKALINSPLYRTSELQKVNLGVSSSRLCVDPTVTPTANPWSSFKLMPPPQSLVESSNPCFWRVWDWALYRMGRLLSWSHGEDERVSAPSSLIHAFYLPCSLAHLLALLYFPLVSSNVSLLQQLICIHQQEEKERGSFFFRRH